MFTVNILGTDLYIEIMSEAHIPGSAIYRFISLQRAREIRTELLHNFRKMVTFSTFLIALIKSFFYRETFYRIVSQTLKFKYHTSV